MSEKWRMVGIAVVFLLAVGLAWFLLMDSGVEDGSAGRVGEPEFGGPVGEIPEFEFDELEDSVVAMSFESSQDGPNFDDGGITSTQLSVGGDADVSVSLSF